MTASPNPDELTALIVDIASCLTPRAKSQVTVLAAMAPATPYNYQTHRLNPSQTAQHHFARKNDGTRIELVVAGTLRHGPMGRLEHGHGAGDVGARRDSDSAYLGRKRIGTADVGDS